MPRKPLRVCAVTGSRADWSLLSVPLAGLRDDPAFALSLVVTGQHLVAAAGDTVRIIENEGFHIDERVDMKLTDDTATGVTKSLGQAVIGFAGALDRLKPDLMFLLGDRYEILAAAQAALIARVPVAHLCGGDVTEGAMDEAIRHGITKMAHIHFVTNEDAGRRVRQLGEDPAQVHVVGSPGLDRIRMTPVMTRDDFFAAVDLAPRGRTLLITFHPVTLEHDSDTQCAEMLAALDDQGPDTGLIFTGANADTGGRKLDTLIGKFAAAHDNAVVHASLGTERYVAALAHADAMVGNSSSGLYEAPSFGLPAVNIGDRQAGRPRAASVIDCPPARDAINAAIGQALEMDRSDIENPYGDGHAADRIVAALKGIGDPRALLKKSFHDWAQP